MALRIGPDLLDAQVLILGRNAFEPAFDLLLNPALALLHSAPFKKLPAQIAADLTKRRPPP
jgi:hypothetical protein